MLGNPDAIHIRRTIVRADRRQIEPFEGIQTSFVADAQQGANCLHHSIKPLFPTTAIVGTAVTACGGPRDLMAAMAMLDFVQPGDILVIATGGDESGAVVGDNWAALAKKQHVVGAVTDGLARDLAGLEEVGLPVFARGVCPNSGFQNGPGQVNTVVSVGGVIVSPGDIVVADQNGVVVVPLDQAAAVAASLQRVIAGELETQEGLSAGRITGLWDASQFSDRGVKYLD
jgi:4-hydroxy-4-methyl-2-oxoglutarate aldolase